MHDILSLCFVFLGLPRDPFGSCCVSGSVNGVGPDRFRSDDEAEVWGGAPTERGESPFVPESTAIRCAN